MKVLLNTLIALGGALVADSAWSEGPLVVRCVLFGVGLMLVVSSAIDYARLAR